MGINRNRKKNEDKDAMQKHTKKQTEDLITNKNIIPQKCKSLDFGFLTMTVLVLIHCTCHNDRYQEQTRLLPAHSTVLTCLLAHI